MVTIIILLCVVNWRISYINLHKKIAFNSTEFVAIIAGQKSHIIQDGGLLFTQNLKALL